jgi:PAS domain S-box-containing protein
MRYIFETKPRSSQQIVKYFWFLWAFLNSLLFLRASDIHIKFDRISIEHGLSQSTVFCMLQDRSGLMWFGTENGLNRYDGYSFKTYYHDPKNSNSISDNTISSIIEDEKGTIWIGTINGGLNRYNNIKETFSSFRKESNNPNSICSDTIRVILEDSKNILWIGTPEGLNRFDSVKGIFLKNKHNPYNPNSLSHDDVTAIYEDKNHNIWIGTQDGGVNLYHPLSKNFSHYRHNPDNPNSLSNDNVRYIYEAPSEPGILWIGTWGGGLNRFDTKTNQFTIYKNQPTNPSSLSYDEVNLIFEDSSHNLWIGTTMGGINILNRETGTFKIYKNQPIDPSSVSNNDILSIIQDRSGIIWIGTTIGGLNKYDSNKNKFSHYKYNPGSPNSLNHWMVRSIVEDHVGKLWVGTPFGLTCIDRQDDRYYYYQHKKSNINSLSFSDVMALTEDRDGQLWVGTWNGLTRISENRRNFFRYFHNPRNTDSLSFNRIFSLHTDKSNTVWIGTSRGLNKYNKDNDNFERFFHDPKNENSICHNFIVEIYVDKNGAIWIGSAGEGISVLDIKTNTFTHFRHNPEDPQSLSHNSISAFYEDSKGSMWIGTADGLNRFIAADGTFHRYGIDDNFPNTAISGILEDKDNNLWVGHFQGLSRYNPDTGEIRNFNVRDGLQSNEFNRGACFKSRTGEMFFGGINGFNTFYPENIKDRNYIPPVILTSLKIFNKTISFSQPLYEIDRITLPYNQNFLSFEFAAIDYSTPGNNTYAYKMEGIDKDWVYCGTRRYANYIKMQPGRYNFRVKGSNNNELWNEEGIKIEIHITPPFWQTLWFRSILFLIFIVSIYIAFQLRIKQLKAKIAKQKQIERILKKSRDDMQKANKLAEFRLAQVKQLVSSISSILIAVDQGGIVFQWNDIAQEFFSLKREEIIGQSLVDRLKGTFEPNQLEGIIQKSLNQDDETNEYELFLKKKGNPCILSIVTNPIVGNSNQNLGLLLICEDITKKKSQEAQKNLMNKLKAVGEMQAGIIHDINTPLQEIKMSSFLISDTISGLIDKETLFNQSRAQPEKDSHNREVIRSIQDVKSISEDININLEQISAIIKALKTFFYPGKERKEYADVNVLLKTTLLMAQNTIRKVATVNTKFTQGIPKLKCFPAELNQVFMNIIINAADAIKDTGRRGNIEISSHFYNNEIKISIKDNGRGIPAHLKEKIFHSFFTTKEMGKGTGQGLSLAKRIVEERHSGQLEYTSQMNKGTQFDIYLPFVPNQSD